MKKSYSEPEIEITIFLSEDIITLSGALTDDMEDADMADAAGDLW